MRTELIGQTFEFEDDEKQLLDGEGVLANLSTLDKAENKFEIADGEKSLLQVYFGWKTPSGTPMVVETYYPSRSGRRQGRRPATELLAAAARRAGAADHRVDTAGACSDPPPEAVAGRAREPARAGHRLQRHRAPANCRRGARRRGSGIDRDHLQPVGCRR